jgi:hypothetical protein
VKAEVHRNPRRGALRVRRDEFTFCVLEPSLSPTRLRESVNTLVARGCVMLLTTIGMALVGGVGTAGTLEDPAVWLEHGLKGTVSNTRLDAHGIALSFSIRKK